MKGKPVTDEQIAKVWEKVIDGRTDPDCVREAAERIGVGHATLTLRLRKLGLAYPRRVLTGAAQAGVDGRVAEPLPLPVVDLRQPYERPSVATLPLNGDGPTGLGKHANAEAAREMIAEVEVERERVAAQWAHELVYGDVGAQTPTETAVPAKVAARAAAEPETPPDYGILYGLIGLLPANGRWASYEKLLWLNAVEAVLKLYVKEVAEGRARP